MIAFTMTHSYESDFEPLIDPLDELTDEDTEIHIQLGMNRRRTMARRVLEYYTGDSQTYLGKEREQELARLIQDGITAAKFLTTTSEADRQQYPAQTEQLEASVAAGIKAKHTLIECNLRFASYYARKSMNIGVEKTPEEDENGEAKEVVPVGAYADIRNLRSPHASLDDRTQIALFGLVKAADKYEPTKTGKRGSSASFIGYAKWHIHQELSRKIPEVEAQGVRLPIHTMEAMRRTRQFPSEFSQEERERAEQIHQLTQSIPFDLLDLGAHASEEADEYYDAPLSPAEVIGDVHEQDYPDNVYHLNTLAKTLREVLKTLSSREAGVIRMRYGLVDGVPRSFEEIGAVYGLTRERIRQIDSKAMSKLRHPNRNKHLIDYLHLDTPTMPQSPHNMPDYGYSLAQIREPDTLQDFTAFGLLEDDELVAKSSKRNKNLKSWQANEDDDWDSPVYTPPTPKNEAEEEAKTAQLFAAILKRADPDDFKKAPEGMSTYPRRTYDHIVESCGESLQLHQIESYWNNAIEPFIEKLKRVNGEDFDLSRVSLLFSLLLAQKMTDESSVELIIPPSLDGKLNYFGTGLKQGKVTVEGNLGDYAGYRMRELAQLYVKGSVGDYAGAHNRDLTSLIIDGSAGKQFAYGAKDETSFKVRDEIKSLAIVPGFKGEIIVGRVTHKNIALKKAIKQVTINDNEL